MSKLEEFNVKERTQWCLGCGDFGILAAVKQALVELGLESHKTCIVSGIGCGSKIPHYIRAYGFEGLHGRLLPAAEAIKLSNHELTVVAIGGDGDGFSEGGNHFLHSCRRNNDITYIVQNNYYFSLTTGQSSPTTKKGMKSKTHLKGNTIDEFMPCATALIAGASFVAATYSGDVMHLKEVIKEGINHKGFAFIECYQPCITWDKQNTYEWYKQHIYYVKDNDRQDFQKALHYCLEPFTNNFEKVPVGIFWQKQRKTFLEDFKVLDRGPMIKNNNIFNRNLDEDFAMLM
ncbi:MAG: thiamine pyrophosphate-dependent enzyme [Candidatus Anstonellales archaeon]